MSTPKKTIPGLLFCFLEKVLNGDGDESGMRQTNLKSVPIGQVQDHQG